MTKDKDLPFFVSLIAVIPFLIKIVLLLLVIYDKASLNLGMGSQSTHVCQCAKIEDFYWSLDLMCDVTRSINSRRKYQQNMYN